MGNLGSIQNMLSRIGARSEISGDLSRIRRAQKLILPGVGAFDTAIRRITQTPLKSVLDEKALVEKVPVLGICLGMQLLTKSSEEGQLPGLGWVAAAAYRFPAGLGLKVPHMGWNTATPISASPLLTGLEADSRYYFVHSYYVKAEDRRTAILSTTHGIKFDAALQSGNIFGTQFHPEKSHRFGKLLLSNFARL